MEVLGDLNQAKMISVDSLCSGCCCYCKAGGNNKTVLGKIYWTVL